MRYVLGKVSFGIEIMVWSASFQQTCSSMERGFVAQSSERNQKFEQTGASPAELSVTLEAERNFGTPIERKWETVLLKFVVR